MEDNMRKAFVVILSISIIMFSSCGKKVKKSSDVKTEAQFKKLLTSNWWGGKIVEKDHFYPYDTNLWKSTYVKMVFNNDGTYGRFECIEPNDSGNNSWTKVESGNWKTWYDKPDGVSDYGWDRDGEYGFQFTHKRGCYVMSMSHYMKNIGSSDIPESITSKEFLDYKSIGSNEYEHYEEKYRQWEKTGLLFN